MKYKYLNKKQVYESPKSKFLLFLYHTIIGRIILKIIYHKWISNVVRLFLNSRLSKPLIKKYINNYKIDMTKYKMKQYNNFNEFFTREKLEIPKTNNDNDFVAICDSKIMVYEIKEDLMIDIKNTKYNIEELIKDKVSGKYNGGYCIIYRLEPKDYHHYIYNDDGKLLQKKEIDGVLHTVNPVAYDKYKVFTENKREVSILETKHFKKIIQIEVGALCVGRIENNNEKQFKRYDEKGYFEFGGSTIIQLIEKSQIRIIEEIIDNTMKNIETQVEIGEKIGKKEQ